MRKTTFLATLSGVLAHAARAVAIGRPAPGAPPATAPPGGPRPDVLALAGLLVALALGAGVWWYRSGRKR
jgi:hypothetical protein